MMKHFKCDLIFTSNAYELLRSFYVTSCDFSSLRSSFGTDVHGTEKVTRYKLKMPRKKIPDNCWIHVKTFPYSCFPIFFHCTFLLVFLTLDVTSITDGDFNCKKTWNLKKLDLTVDWVRDKQHKKKVSSPCLMIALIHLLKE